MLAHGHALAPIKGNSMSNNELQLTDDQINLNRAVNKLIGEFKSGLWFLAGIITIVTGVGIGAVGGSMGAVIFLSIFGLVISLAGTIFQPDGNLPTANPPKNDVDQETVALEADKQ